MQFDNFCFLFCIHNALCLTAILNLDMSKIIVSNEYRDAKADDMEEIKKLIANVHGDDRKLEHSQLIVACSGNKIVGCIRTVQAEEDCKEIASLVVDPKYRGGGVG